MYSIVTGYEISIMGKPKDGGQLGNGIEHVGTFSEATLIMCAIEAMIKKTAVELGIIGDIAEKHFGDRTVIEYSTKIGTYELAKTTYEIVIVEEAQAEQKG